MLRQLARAQVGVEWAKANHTGVDAAAWIGHGEAPSGEKSVSHGRWTSNQLLALQYVVDWAFFKRLL
jgi:hypothetical protein